MVAAVSDATVRNRPIFGADGATIVRHRMVLFRKGGGRYDVEGTRVGVGSAPGNEVCLEGDSTVSRHHCEIVVRDARYVLRDLDSTNGTFVSGVQVREAYLEPGMEVAVGGSVLEFEPDARLLRVAPSEETRFGELVGTSAQMRSVFSLLREVAPSTLTILLSGESGTGKELAARAVHEASGRGPFVVVDCAALHGNLIESELFGHERGAFTGAHKQRAGAFEAAARGTVFLDEVGELPLELQPRLLRVLERREVTRVGSNEVVDLDVRVLAATHRDLPQMVREGTFREDLYYRLAEIVVDLPPLRERMEDLRALVAAILAREGGEVQQVAPVAWAQLESRPYRGNVRELRNLVRRAAALSRGGSALTAEGVKRALTFGRPIERAPGTEELHLELCLRDARKRWIDDHTRRYLERLMTRFEGDLDAVAAHADVHRKSVQRLMRELDD